MQGNTVANTKQRKTYKTLSINELEVALVLLFQVCFASNFSEIKFQAVTSGM